MCHDLFSGYTGEPPMFTGLGEPEKVKSVVRLGLRFCYFVYILIYNELFLSFVELFSFKSYDIATAYL